jgi:hypothetical protein
MKIAMRSRVLLGLLCVLIPSGDSWGKTVLTDDPRCNQSIRVVEEGDQLAEILTRLQQTSGVKLQAVAPMSDTVLVCRYVGTLAGFMDVLTNFFAVHREHPARWVRTGAAGKWKYRLERDIATVQLVERLRQDREGALSRRMELLLQALRTPANQLTGLLQSDPRIGASVKGALPEARQMSFLLQFARLSPAQRSTAYSGGQVTLPIAALTNDRQDARAVLTDVAGGEDGFWSGQGTVAFTMLGPGPLQRSFTVRVGSDPLHPGTEGTGSVGVPQLFPDLKPERQQHDWREWYGDPAPVDTRKVKLLAAGERLPSRISRREVLLKIASRARINLIADDTGQDLEFQTILATSSVDQLLDRACMLRPGTGDRRSENHGSFWRKVGETYLIRSLSWPEEETRLIPNRWLRTWGASEKKHGHLTVDDVIEMAGLHPQQLIQLSLWYPQAEEIIPVQAPLRWYARAAPVVRRLLNSPGGLALDRLVLRPADFAFRDADPAAETPPYVELMRQIPSDRLHLHVLEGQASPPGWKPFPIVGVIFREYSGGQPVGQPSLFSVPLVRNFPRVDPQTGMLR